MILCMCIKCRKFMLFFRVSLVANTEIPYYESIMVYPYRVEGNATGQ